MGLLIIGLCGQSVFLGVDHFHRPEETLHAVSFFSEPGGKGYNQAVAAGRMGANVTFAGTVGQDADGEMCAERLVREGIRPRMFIKPGRTAYAAILTNAEGENRVTVYSGVQLDAEDVLALEQEFETADILLLTPEVPEEAFAQAVLLAKKHGVKLVINPAPYFDWVRKYCPDAWLLTPNRSEACALLGCEEGELMHVLSIAPYARMVVTLGADGAVCLEEGKITRIPAEKADVVDTTGAGDCLNGALCALLLEGMPLEDAAKKAVCAATISVSHAHVLDGMPKRQEVG